MNVEASWLFIRSRSLKYVSVASFGVLTISAAWMYQVGTDWESTTLVRLFTPLLLALVGSTFLDSPFGDLERTISSDVRTYRYFGIATLIAGQSLLLMILFGFNETSVALIRNLLALTGMSACVALILDPRQVWVVLFPPWALLFVLEQSRYPELWPNVLWAWPLASTSSFLAWTQSAIWMLLGLIAIAVGGKHRRGLEK